MGNDLGSGHEAQAKLLHEDIYSSWPNFRSSGVPDAGGSGRMENLSPMTNAAAQAFARVRWPNRLDKYDTLYHMERLLPPAGLWSKRRIAKALDVSRAAVLQWSRPDGTCAPDSLAKLPTDPKQFIHKEETEL